MGRAENVLIFQDTLKFIEQLSFLSDAIKHTQLNSKFYPGSWQLSRDANTSDAANNARVTVTTNRTFEAAIKLSKAFPDKKIAVLNFASATIPGGGVVKGSTAQEESLCRISTLYPCLNTDYFIEKFYKPHIKIGDPKHNNDIIYTPGIVICKKDSADAPIRLSCKKFVTVDVISCAAPNLRVNPNNPFNDYNRDVATVNMSEYDQEALHYSRGKQILDVALDNNVDILILGAFGCGAFKNNPRAVAAAYKKLLPSYLDKFSMIEFAVYCGSDDTNYRVFKEILG